jgi:hypothetical protein
MWKVIAFLDHLVMSRTNRKEFLEKERRYLKFRAESKDVWESGLSTLDIIDQKVSSLLTHVSVMIAALSMFSGTVITTGLAHYLMIFEIVIYVFVAIGLLRCIRLSGPELSLGSVEENMANEVCFRRRFYQFLLDVTIVLTLAFIMTIGLHYL